MLMKKRGLSELRMSGLVREVAQERFYNQSNFDKYVDKLRGQVEYERRPREVRTECR
jgi:hypothetical protein